MEWRWPCCKGGWGYTRAQCVFTYANYLRHEGWLLEWRADAPIFLSAWRSAGRKVGGDDSRKILQDAQGNKIPTQGKREVEITLRYSLGRSVVFRERVTISDAVSQPILCFGKMMEQGWSIDGREQMMVHRDALEEIKAPVEMQNRRLWWVTFE